MSTPAKDSSSLKRKHHHSDDAGPSTKKPKKERKHHHKSTHSDEEFVLVQASLVVSIPPVFASNPSQGVEEMLDSMVMRYVSSTIYSFHVQVRILRYIPSLRGVVLTHSNLRFLQSSATIQGDSPYATCNVGFDATVWSPRVGQLLSASYTTLSLDRSHLHASLRSHCRLLQQERLTSARQTTFPCWYTVPLMLRSRDIISLSQNGPLNTGLQRMIQSMVQELLPPLIYKTFRKMNGKGIRLRQSAW